MSNWNFGEIEIVLKNLFTVKSILPIMLGIIVGIVMFILGNADDAPGLSFIGLITAFLLIMRGIYHSKIISNGYHIPIILLIFGVIGIIFPIILFLDGELNGLSIVVFIGNIIGIALIITALIRIKKVRKK